MKKLLMFFAAFKCLAAYALIAPDVAALLDSHKTLYDGGGYPFFRQGGCVVVGVGIAPLGEFERSRKIAVQKAESELLKTLAGVKIETSESVETETAEKSGTVKITEKRISEYRERVKSNLSNLKIRGYEIGGGVLKAVVCAYVDVKVPATKTNPSEFAKDVELSPEWRGVLASLGEISLGGVKVLEHNNAVYAVAVKAVNPKLSRIDGERVANLAASRDIVKFVKGFSLKDELSACETLSTIIANGDETNAVSQTQNEISESVARGGVKNIVRIGTFVNIDTMYTTYIYALKLFEK